VHARTLAKERLTGRAPGCDAGSMDPPVAPPSALERGRACFAGNAWRDAYEQLSAANGAAPLEPEDLEQLAMSAFLIGKDAESSDLLARVHNQFLERAQVERAVHSAYWLSQLLVGRGEMARAAGWLGRAQRLLEESKLDCVARGFVLVPVAVQTFMSGDAVTAHRLFSDAAEIATRFNDRTLGALARHGQGRTLIRLGETAKGVALLDETMVAIEAGDVLPVVAGVVYCSMIESCYETFDLRRAQEWTASLSRWFDAQPDLVPFRGVCLVHRSELMQLHGDWPAALNEAQSARERLSQPPPPQPSFGSALYQVAELHRLRGEFADAEKAYRDSSQWSRKVRPGLALLRLAMGQVDAAFSAIRVQLSEAQASDRPRVLSAFVEIALAAGDVSSARSAADELSRIATQMDAAWLRALSAQANGAVLIAEGDPQAASTVLRRACVIWQEIGAPYEGARVRELIGLAARALGDQETSALELEAARSSFLQLGALPDVERVDARFASPPAVTGSSLTSRELQVLRLVAQGKSNKAIARDLSISEKTVHRHVSNIFLKLGLSSRAAATAYAFQHDLM
jgi:ATP/maltotriose-dependent transcriptional regulator MalT